MHVPRPTTCSHRVKPMPSGMTWAFVSGVSSTPHRQRKCTCSCQVHVQETRGKMVPPEGSIYMAHAFFDCHPQVFCHGQADAKAPSLRCSLKWRPFFSRKHVLAGGTRRPKLDFGGRQCLLLSSGNGGDSLLNGRPQTHFMQSGCVSARPTDLN